MDKRQNNTLLEGLGGTRNFYLTINLVGFSPFPENFQGRKIHTLLWMAIPWLVALKSFRYERTFATFCTHFFLLFLGWIGLLKTVFIYSKVSSERLVVNYGAVSSLGCLHKKWWFLCQAVVTSKALSFFNCRWSRPILLNDRTHPWHSKESSKGKLKGWSLPAIPSSFFSLVYAQWLCLCCRWHPYTKASDKHAR